MATVVHYKDVQKELKFAEEELSHVEANIRDLMKLTDINTTHWRTQISSGWTVDLDVSILLKAHLARKEQLESQIKEFKEMDAFLTKAIQAFK